MEEIYKVIGLMSGTSLDGLDIAYCIFRKSKNKWEYRIEVAETVIYSEEWKKKLKNSNNTESFDLLHLNNDFGYFIGYEVKKFVEKHNIYPDFVASHGHTVFHQPDKKLTYQIGSGDCISAKCGLDVVCDFRSLDVAMGGQGAPLVPIGDKLLFPEFDYCINLGGIANISFEKNNERIAYDICPMNMVLNYLANFLGMDYDKNGEIASNADFDVELFNKFENLDYYNQSYPKSLGKEWVLNNIFPIIDASLLSNEDKLRTFSEHIVSQLLKSTSEKSCAQILFTGGGAYNKFIIDLFKAKSSHNVLIPDNYCIDFKEAMIFAFLGVLKLRNEINCLKSVTGADKNSIGGKLIIASK